MSSSESISNQNRGVGRISSNFERSRPIAKPASKKDFTKIMKDDGIDPDDISDADVDEGDEKAAGTSLFNLASSAPPKQKPAAGTSSVFTMQTPQEEDPNEVAGMQKEVSEEEAPSTPAKNTAPLTSAPGDKKIRSDGRILANKKPVPTTSLQSGEEMEEQVSLLSSKEDIDSSDDYIPEDQDNEIAENEEPQLRTTNTPLNQTQSTKTVLSKPNPYASSPYTNKLADTPSSSGKPQEGDTKTSKSSAPPSLFDLTKQVSGNKTAQKGDLGDDTEDSKQFMSKDDTKVSKKGMGANLAGKPDASFVSPMAQQPAEFSIDKAQTEKAPPSAALKTLVTQIVKEIQVIQTNNKTETVVTLQYPPIMAGSTITLSTLNDAKREFNITFAGLTSEGKVFIDEKLSDGTLKDALTMKGVVVQTIITQTEPQTIISKEAQEAFTRNQEREDQQRQQQREDEGETYDET